ncbi:MAG: hypothetical protein N2111_08885 [Candidatus Sumerlaeaceae bacterium]|nr:hypothetical protein [Candidatus Sumerlaeaceae bacterium]
MFDTNALRVLAAAVMALLRPACTALLLLSILPGPAWAAALRLVSAGCVADEEFPHLLPYIYDGWEMKYEFAAPQPRPSLGATLRLVLGNAKDTPVTVTSVRLNGLALTEHILPAFREVDGVRAASYALNPETTTPSALRARLEALGDPVWYSAYPRVLEPGGWSEVSVRLRSVPRVRSVRLTVAGDDRAGSVSVDIPITTAPALRVSFASFSDAGDCLFVYLRRSDGRDFDLAGLGLDGAPAALGKSLPTRSFRGVLPVEVPLNPPWPHGSFHLVTARTRQGLQAATTLRARDAFFCLGMWGYRNNGATEADRTSDTLAAFAANLFNTAMGMHFVDSPDAFPIATAQGLRVNSREPNPTTTGHPAVYARFLLDEPDVQDSFLDSLPGSRRVGSYAQGLVSRRDRWLRMDPRSLSLLNVDLTCKPENWWTYGSIADILALDPYYQGRLVDAYWRHPGYLGRNTTPLFVYACAEVARWAASPRPTHVILNCVSHVEANRRFRYGTPEEKRIEFFHALAAGAKGISYWWFTPYGEYRGCGTGEPEAEAMLAELRRLNAMARSLDPLLSHAWPAIGPGAITDPITTCAPAWLMPRTLYAGTHAVVVVLVNRDHACDAAGTRWQPIERARVFVRIPPWLTDPSASLVTPEETRALSPKLVGTDVTEYEIQDFPLAALLVLRQNRNIVLQP